MDITIAFLGSGIRSCSRRNGLSGPRSCSFPPPETEANHLTGPWKTIRMRTLSLRLCSFTILVSSTCRVWNLPAHWSKQGRPLARQHIGRLGLASARLSVLSSKYRRSGVSEIHEPVSRRQGISIHSTSKDSFARDERVVFENRYPWDLASILRRRASNGRKEDAWLSPQRGVGRTTEVVSIITTVEKLLLALMKASPLARAVRLLP
jgi:hypothetical protein